MKGVNKKGVSPVIATILLVALVIVIALIIFLFMRGIGEEAITKFGKENIKLACENVEFKADYLDGELAISNMGDVPIFDMKMKIMKDGSYETKSLKTDFPEQWPSSGLTQGGVASIIVPGEAGVEKIAITPVLVGKSKQGAKKSYTCEQGLYEYEITI